MLSGDFGTCEVTSFGSLLLLEELDFDLGVLRCFKSFFWWLIVQFLCIFSLFWPISDLKN